MILPPIGNKKPPRLPFRSGGFAVVKSINNGRPNPKTKSIYLEEKSGEGWVIRKRVRYHTGDLHEYEQAVWACIALINIKN